MISNREDLLEDTCVGDQTFLSPPVKSSSSTRDSLRPLPPSTTPGCSPATSKTGRPSVADGSQSVASALGATKGSSPPVSALAPKSTHGSTTLRGNQTADPKLKNVSWTIGMRDCVRDFACLLLVKKTHRIFRQNMLSSLSRKSMIVCNRDKYGMV